MLKAVEIAAGIVFAGVLLLFFFGPLAMGDEARRAVTSVAKARDGNAAVLPEHRRQRLLEPLLRAGVHAQVVVGRPDAGEIVLERHIPLEGPPGDLDILEQLRSLGNRSS